MQLTEKEKELMKDMVSAEKLSIEKYQRSSTEAKNGELKNLFTAITAVEQSHLYMLNQISAGNNPATNTNVPTPQVPAQVSYSNEQDKQADQYLCSDGLSCEKHVSGIYDTCIFEYAQPELRKTLNTIQAQEQAHGEFFYDYMKKAGMYN